MVLLSTKFLVSKLVLVSFKKFVLLSLYALCCLMVLRLENGRFSTGGGSEDYAPSPESTFPKNETTQAHAILISGQCQRFIYRENDGPLLQFSNDTQQQPIIDVFIALQCEDKLIKSRGKTPDTPYINATDLNVSDIEHHFHQRGARRVEVQILQAEHLDNAFQDATFHVTHYHGKDRRDTPKKMKEMFKGNWGEAHKRWFSEFRKFYSRHLVYRMARRAARNNEKDYSVYVYWREDNFFYEPLHLDQVVFWNHHNNIANGHSNQTTTAADQEPSNNNDTTTHNDTTTDDDDDSNDSNDSSSNETPYIVVDKDCKFQAYSDKMYVLNGAGADLLFGRTHAEFMATMKRYILLGFYKSNYEGGLQRPARQWMQPESFTQDTFSHAVVQEQYLKRVDVRFVWNSTTNELRRCIHQLYYKCQRKEAKEAATRIGLPPCDEI